MREVPSTLLLLPLLALVAGAGGAEEAGGRGAEGPAAAGPAAATVDAAGLERRAVALKRVSEKLLCQCGCKMILAECSHQSCPFALPERKAIVASLEAGKTDAAIVADYVTQHGTEVLAIPPTEGSVWRRFAWFAPYLALALGGVTVVVYLFRITRAQAPAIAVASGGTMTVTDDAEKEAYRRRVEAELGGPAGGR